MVVVAEHGFVNMADPEAAHDVILSLNGHCLHNSSLHVDYSEEFKQYLISNRVPFSATRDPLTGTYISRHPPYPEGEQFESPFYTEDPSLLTEPHLVEERLRKVNQELRALDRSTIFSDPDRTRTRERRGGQSPSREQRYRRSRSPRWRRDRYSRSPDRGGDRGRDRYQHRSEREERPERGDGQSISRSPRNSAGEELREYELRVGGLHTRVSPHHLISLFTGYGKVSKVEPVKNFAFVRLVTRESLALAACEELSGATCRQNKVSVSPCKGSGLIEKLRKKDDRSI